MKLMNSKKNWTQIHKKMIEKKLWLAIKLFIIVKFQLLLINRSNNYKALLLLNFKNLQLYKRIKFKI